MAWNDESELRCKFELVCPKKWDELEDVGDQQQRHCGQCDRRVHRVDSAVEMVQAQADGLCVTVEYIPSEHPVIDMPQIPFTLTGVMDQRDWRRTRRVDTLKTALFVGALACAIGGLVYWLAF